MVRLDALGSWLNNISCLAPVHLNFILAHHSDILEDSLHLEVQAAWLIDINFLHLNVPSKSFATFITAHLTLADTFYRFWTIDNHGEGQLDQRCRSDFG